jgi:hypothetical protein
MIDRLARPGSQTFEGPGLDKGKTGAKTDPKSPARMSVSGVEQLHFDRTFPSESRIELQNQRNLQVPGCSPLAVCAARQTQSFATSA